ncbi:hypothetical protein PFISCL1PPCAC_1609, partial [Pristionchus fissidentatus]
LMLMLLVLLYIRLSRGDPNLEDEAMDDSCDDEPVEKGIKTLCYFSTKRKSGSETVDRKKEFQVSDICDGNLISLHDLSENHDDLTPWKGAAICKAHLNELSRQFFKLGKRDVPHVRENGERCHTCVFPDFHSANGALAPKRMSYQMPRNVLLEKNFLVPVGIPLCQRHYRAISKTPNPLPVMPVVPINAASIYNDNGQSQQEETMNSGELIPVNNPILDDDTILDNTLTMNDGMIPVNIPIVDDDAILNNDPILEDGLIDIDNPLPQELILDGTESISSQGSIVADSVIADPTYCGEKKEKEEYVCHYEKFVRTAGISRAVCTMPFSQYVDRTKKEKARTQVKVLDLILDMTTDTPESRAYLKTLILEYWADHPPRDEKVLLDAVMKGVSDAFNKASNYNEKLSILSIFALSIQYKTISNYIPNLSERMWREAKKRAMSPKKEHPNTLMRERYDPAKINFFISCITSPAVLVTLPYGEQRTKDSSGNVVILPNTVRNNGIYETIEICERLALESGNKDLVVSNSTAYRILSMLPSLRSTSQTCVDYFQADATMAFIKFRETLTKLDDMKQMDSAEVATFKRAFEQSRVQSRKAGQ